MRIAECVLHETLYESNSTRVYRAKHEPSNRNVIVKQARVSRTSLISRLRREYRLATGIGDEAVVEALAFEGDIDFPAIIYADFGGVALSKVLAARREPLPVAEFLDLACRLTRIIEVIHSHSIVHQDVKPANIILNPDSGEARMADFGIAVLGDSGVMPSLRMRGTLAYMAPEQSGRMNRAIDHRADLYSLGVTLYEILTGRLPFENSEDILEMIHRHMAVRPLDPHVISNRIPEPLSAIIMKLLAKDAEDRYQSAGGLLKDFNECRRQWLGDGAISNFAPGLRDFSDVFAVSNKIYGREQEKNQMIQAFRRVVSGGRELCLIHGFAGIGKSAVAYNLQEVVLESRGYFVSGKFDQYQSGIPYSGILKAFRQAINEILKEEADDIAAKKAKLGMAFGSNGGVLVDVIPEIERLIGPQPEPTPVGPEEAENRFISVFQQFVRALASPERPLVLLIDDLQWADAASLRLLRVLLMATEIRHLMILGAYRDNEVDATHPLTETLALLEERDVPMQRISMQALDAREVVRLVANTLQSDPERAEALGFYIHQKTGGNPFFIREFLYNLYRNGDIYFAADVGAWIWDADEISSLPAPDQIGELMAHKIQHLEPVTRSALQYAACIGARFDLDFLAALLGKTEEQTREILQPALREGLLSPLLSGFDERLKDQDNFLEATLEFTGVEKQFQF
ncbi:MAG: AAA family ATPase [bacterium]|nr:AAA family ATPase [bacterium]